MPTNTIKPCTIAKKFFSQNAFIVEDKVNALNFLLQVLFIRKGFKPIAIGQLQQLFINAIPWIHLINSVSKNKKGFIAQPPG